MQARAELGATAAMQEAPAAELGEATEAGLAGGVAGCGGQRGRAGALDPDLLLEAGEAADAAGELGGGGSLLQQLQGEREM